MDFAKNQLTKHGWKDGSGLGKSESGITEAIKVKIKNDNKGVGHDAGAEFTFHWWDHVFNKAASNIDVQTTEEGVEVSNTGATERSKSKSYKSYADKKMLYGKFVKGSTLSGGTETEEPNTADDTEPVEPIKHALMPSNEEEIFKMCGGRTAHKGARHGLKLNGKLQRIEQQEQLLLDKMMAKSANQSQDNINTEQEAVESANQNCEPNEKTEITEMSEKKKSKKNKKKKRKDIEADIEGSVDVSKTIAEDLEIKESKKSKKKRKREKEQKIDLVVNDDLELGQNDSKKRKHENQDNDIANTVDNENTSKKKKKKRKKEKVE